MRVAQARSNPHENEVVQRLGRMEADMTRVRDERSSGRRKEILESKAVQGLKELVDGNFLHGKVSGRMPWTRRGSKEGKHWSSWKKFLKGMWRMHLSQGGGLEAGGKGLSEGDRGNAQR